MSSYLFHSKAKTQPYKRQSTRSALCRSYLTSLRSSEKFEVFYQSVVKSAKGLTSAPMLPQYHTPPKRPGEDAAQAHRFDTPEEYFRQQYFEAIDVLVKQLKDRFEQRRPEWITNGRKNRGDPAGILCCVIQDYCSLERLQVQTLHVYKLQMLPYRGSNFMKQLATMLPTSHGTKVTSVRTITNVLTEVEVGKAMLPDVAALVEIYYTLPVTTATGERSFSALRRLKTFLRSTMTQPRLKQCHAAAYPQGQMRPP